MNQKDIEKKIKYYQRRHKKLQKQLKEYRETLKILKLDNDEWALRDR